MTTEPRRQKPVPQVTYDVEVTITPRPRRASEGTAGRTLLILFGWLIGFAALGAGTWLLVRDRPDVLARFVPALVPAAGPPALYDSVEEGDIGRITTPAIELFVGDVIEWSFEGRDFQPYLIVWDSRDEFGQLNNDERAFPLPEKGGAGRSIVDETTAGTGRKVELQVDRAKPRFSHRRTSLRILRTPESRALERGDAATVE